MLFRDPNGYYFSNALKCLTMVSMLECSGAVLPNGGQSVLLVGNAEHVCDREHIRWRPLVDLGIRFRRENDVFPFG